MNKRIIRTLCGALQWLAAAGTGFFVTIDQWLSLGFAVMSLAFLGCFLLLHEMLLKGDEQ